MTSIVNSFTHPVILDDDRDPDVSWEHHLERGSAGGVDLAYPYGTEVALNAAGRLVFDSSPSGSGGRTATLYLVHPELAYIQYMHLSEGRSGAFQAGDTPIKSGASGFGSDHGYAPHLHVHAYDNHGRRVNLFHYFDAAPAGGTKTQITDPDSPEEDEMKPRQIHFKTAAGAIIRALIVPGTGYFVKWTEGGSTYANAMSVQMETGASTEMTESLFNVFEREAKALRPKDALAIELAQA